MVAGSNPVGHPIFPFQLSLCNTGVMLPGYNHNVEYQGRTFHIQTEDSGIDNPHIISHLFEGGNILETRKCDYANILGNEQRDKVLMSLMLNQHQALIRELESGELDKLLEGPAPKEESSEHLELPVEPEPEPEPEPELELESEPEVEPSIEPVNSETLESGVPAWLSSLPETRIIHRRQQASGSQPRSQQELDELAQVTIRQIVDAGTGMPMPASSSSQDTLADALQVILSSVEEDAT
ncbi:MAG: hypothetical protein HOI23_11115 [Deltaproteobacteria bacterium]|nr:hypothetical protein [Deltaproteobacteria bacterium]MBT6436059.1 hypothetical protein [Deltaproteobacteria bacterium]